MNKIGTLLTFAAAAGLTGCATNGTKGDVDPELHCQDRTVTVNHGPAFLIAYPEYIQVCEGQTITIRIRPRVRAGDAKTQQGRGNPAVASWLDRDNKDHAAEIRIEVPEKTVPEKKRDIVFKYSIGIAGVGTLDPRVRVVRRGPAP
jgi:hypothetical protein